MPTPDKPAGIILAGGRATRMGGGDKGLLRLGPKRLIDHVLDRLAPQCGPIALSANGDPARFGDLGLPVLPDMQTGYPGPLAGILAGMEWAATLGHHTVVSVAADTPFFPTDYVAQLVRAQTPGTPVLAASDDGDRLWRQPTFGMWPVDLRDDLRTTLANGQFKVSDWADRHAALVVAFSTRDGDPFFNVNRPADLDAAHRRLGQSG